MPPEAAIADTSASQIETPARDWSKLDLPDDAPDSPPAQPIPAKEPDKPAEKPPEKPADAAAVSPELAKLDALLAAEPPEPKEEPPAPALSHAAQQLDVWKANPEFAEQAVGAAQNMIHLELAAQERDVPKVLGMFHPDFVEALREHLYQTEKEKIVERFIAEHEGKPLAKPDPEVARLRAELDGIKSTLTAEEQRKQTAAQQAQAQQSKQAYRNYWDSLFKSITPEGATLEPKTKNKLRGWVLDSITDAAEAGDKDALKTVAQIRQGRYAPLGIKFREVYAEFLKDQKVQTTTDAHIRNTQEQHSQTGKLGTAASDAAAPAGEQDFDADGKRTQGYLKRQLSKIPGWFED